MVTVGIKNLKDSLSRYMRLVKSGETVLVTDHNHIIAEIVPASIENAGTHHLNEYLREQSDHGKIEKAEKKLTIQSVKTESNIDLGLIKRIYHDTRDER